VVWIWVKNQEWGRDRLYVLLPFVFPRGLKSPCQWLCSGGWEVFVLVGVRGFWGAAKPQAVFRCARFFWGRVVGSSLLRRKRRVVVVFWFWMKGCGCGGVGDKRFLSGAAKRGGGRGAAEGISCGFAYPTIPKAGSWGFIFFWGTIGGFNHK